MTNRLAEDWIALWQSELTAMAADRELRESWSAMLALWASAASALAFTQPHDPSRSPVPAQPPRPAPAAAPPEPRLDEIDHLNRRIAELERRLAAFERDRDPTETGT